MRRAWILALCLASATACAEETARPLEINAKSLPLAYADRDATTLGKLRHRGTLKLTSPDSEFGGLSGFIVSADGTRFLAITDASHWLTGELKYANGRLVGISGTTIAPLRDKAGTPLSGKAGDAEGLTGSLDGDVYVSFERDHRILKYPVASKGLDARGREAVLGGGNDTGLGAKLGEHRNNGTRPPPLKAPMPLPSPRAPAAQGHSTVFPSRLPPPGSSSRLRRARPEGPSPPAACPAAVP